MDHVIVALLVLVAALAQSTVGFGFAVVFVPLAALVVDPRVAVATSLLAGPAVAVVSVLEAKPRPPVRPVLPLAIAAIAGTPLGIVVLTQADETLLRVVVGLAVLAGVVASVGRGRATSPPRSRALPLVGVGLLAGLSRGATSMGGPPVVLYLHWTGAAPRAIRLTLLTYLALIGLGGVPPTLLSGEVTADVLQFLAVAAPAITAAILLGRRIRPRLSEAWLRGISMGLLTVSSVAAIGGAVAHII